MTLDVTAIIVALISGGTGVFAVMQSRAATRKTAMLEQRKVDKDAAVEQRRLDMEEDRSHWARTDDIIARLESEVERLDRLLAAARHELEETHTDNAALRGRVDELELHVQKLKATVALLQEELRSHGLPVPGDKG